MGNPVMRLDRISEKQQINKVVFPSLRHGTEQIKKRLDNKLFVKTDNHLYKTHIRDQESNSYCIKIDDVKLGHHKDYQIYYFLDENRKKFAEAIVNHQCLWIRAEHKNLTIEIDKKLSLQYCIIESKADISLKTMAQSSDNVLICARNLHIASSVQFNANIIEIDCETVINAGSIYNRNNISIKAECFTHDEKAIMNVGRHCEIKCGAYVHLGAMSVHGSTVVTSNHALIDGDLSSGHMYMAVGDKLFFHHKTRMIVYGDAKFNAISIDVLGARIKIEADHPNAVVEFLSKTLDLGHGATIESTQNINIKAGAYHQESAHILLDGTGEINIMATNLAVGEGSSLNTYGTMIAKVKKTAQFDSSTLKSKEGIQIVAHKIINNAEWYCEKNIDYQAKHCMQLPHALIYAGEKLNVSESNYVWLDGHIIAVDINLDVKNKLGSAPTTNIACENGIHVRAKKMILSGQMACRQKIALLSVAGQVIKSDANFYAGEGFDIQAGHMLCTGVLKTGKNIEIVVERYFNSNERCRMVADEITLTSNKVHQDGIFTAAMLTLITHHDQLSVDGMLDAKDQIALISHKTLRIGEKASVCSPRLIHLSAREVTNDGVVESNLIQIITQSLEVNNEINAIEKLLLPHMVNDINIGVHAKVHGGTHLRMECNKLSCAGNISSDEEIILQAEKSALLYQESHLSTQSRIQLYASDQLFIAGHASMAKNMEFLSEGEIQLEESARIHAVDSAIVKSPKIINHSVLFSKMISFLGEEQLHDKDATIFAQQAISLNGGSITIDGDVTSDDMVLITAESHFKSGKHAHINSKNHMVIYSDDIKISGVMNAEKVITLGGIPEIKEDAQAQKETLPKNARVINLRKTAACDAGDIMIMAELFAQESVLNAKKINIIAAKKYIYRMHAEFSAAEGVNIRTPHLDISKDMNLYQKGFISSEEALKISGLGQLISDQHLFISSKTIEVDVEIKANYLSLSGENITIQKRGRLRTDPAEKHETSLYYEFKKDPEKYIKEKGKDKIPSTKQFKIEATHLNIHGKVFAGISLKSLLSGNLNVFVGGKIEAPDTFIEAEALYNAGEIEGNTVFINLNKPLINGITDTATFNACYDHSEQSQIYYPHISGKNIDIVSPAVLNVMGALHARRHVRICALASMNAGMRTAFHGISENAFLALDVGLNTVDIKELLQIIRGSKNGEFTEFVQELISGKAVTALIEGLKFLFPAYRVPIALISSLVTLAMNMPNLIKQSDKIKELMSTNELNVRDVIPFLVGIKDAVMSAVSCVTMANLINDVYKKDSAKFFSTTALSQGLSRDYNGTFTDLIDIAVLLTPMPRLTQDSLIGLRGPGLTMMAGATYTNAIGIDVNHVSASHRTTSKSYFQYAGGIYAGNHLAFEGNYLMLDADIENMDLQIAVETLQQLEHSMISTKQADIRVKNLDQAGIIKLIKDAGMTKESVKVVIDNTHDIHENAAFTLTSNKKPAESSTNMPPANNPPSASNPPSDDGQANSPPKEQSEAPKIYDANLVKNKGKFVIENVDNVQIGGYELMSNGSALRIMNAFNVNINAVEQHGGTYTQENSRVNVDTYNQNNGNLILSKKSELRTKTHQSQCEAIVDVDDSKHIATDDMNLRGKQSYTNAIVGGGKGAFSGETHQTDTTAQFTGDLQFNDALHANNSKSFAKNIINNASDGQYTGSNLFSADKKAETTQKANLMGDGKVTLIGGEQAELGGNVGVDVAVAGGESVKLAAKLKDKKIEVQTKHLMQTNDSNIETHRSNIQSNTFDQNGRLALINDTQEALLSHMNFHHVGKEGDFSLTNGQQVDSPIKKKEVQSDQQDKPPENKPNNPTPSNDKPPQYDYNADKTDVEGKFSISGGAKSSIKELDIIGDAAQVNYNDTHGNRIGTLNQQGGIFSENNASNIIEGDYNQKAGKLNLENNSILDINGKHESGKASEKNVDNSFYKADIIQGQGKEKYKESTIEANTASFLGNTSKEDTRTNVKNDLVYGNMNLQYKNSTAIANNIKNNSRVNFSGENTLEAHKEITALHRSHMHGDGGVQLIAKKVTPGSVVTARVYLEAEGVNANDAIQSQGVYKHFKPTESLAIKTTGEQKLQEFNKIITIAVEADSITVAGKLNSTRNIQLIANEGNVEINHDIKSTNTIVHAAHDVNMRGVNVEGTNYAQVTAAHDVNAENTRRFYHGRYGREVEFKPTRIIGGKGEGYEGVGAYISADNKVNFRHSSVLSGGTNVIRGVRGIIVKHDSHYYKSDETVSGGFFNKKKEVSYDTQIGKNEFLGLKNVFISPEGDVRLTATNLIAPDGNYVTAKGPIKMMEAIGIQETRKKRTTLGGLITTKSEKIKDEFSEGVLLVDKHETQLVSLEGGIEGTGVNVISKKFINQALNSKIKYGVSILNHSRQTSSVSFALTGTAAELIRMLSNKPSGSDLTQFDPSLRDVSQLTQGGQNSVEGHALAGANAAASAYNLGQEIYQNGSLDTLMGHTGLGGNEQGFNPRVAISVGFHNETMKFQTASGSNWQCGEMIMITNDNLELMGVNYNVSGNAYIKAKQYIHRGVELNSSYESKDQTITVGVNLTGNVDGGYSEQNTSSRSTTHQHAHGKIGGTLELDVDKMVLDGSSIETDRIKGRADVIDIITRQNEHDFHTEGYSASTSGNVSANQMSSQDRTTGEKATLHVKQGINTDPDCQFKSNEVNLTGGLLTSDGENLLQAKINATSVIDTHEASGYSISTNVKQFMPQEPSSAQDNALAEPLPEGQQDKPKLLTPLFTTIRTREHKEVEHLATVSGANGYQIDPSQVTGNLNTDLNQVTRVLSDFKESLDMRAYDVSDFMPKNDPKQQPIPQPDLWLEPMPSDQSESDELPVVQDEKPPQGTLHSSHQITVIQENNETSQLYIDEALPFSFTEVPDSKTIIVTPLSPEPLPGGENGETSSPMYGPGLAGMYLFNSASEAGIHFFDKSLAGVAGSKLVNASLNSKLFLLNFSYEYGVRQGDPHAFKDAMTTAGSEFTTDLGLGAVMPLPLYILTQGMVMMGNYYLEHPGLSDYHEIPEIEKFIRDNEARYDQMSFWERFSFEDFKNDREEHRMNIAGSAKTAEWVATAYQYLNKPAEWVFDQAGTNLGKVFFPADYTPPLPAESSKTDAGTFWMYQQQRHPSVLVSEPEVYIIPKQSK